MAFFWQPFVTMEALDQLGVKDTHALLSGLSASYRIIDVSGYGSPSDPRFAITWAARPARAPKQIVVFPKGTAELAAYVNGATVQGITYSPVLVTAVSKSGTQPLFLVVLERRTLLPTIPRPMLVYDLTPSYFTDTKTRPDPSTPQPSGKATLSKLTEIAGSLEDACSQARKGQLTDPASMFPLTDSRFAFARSLARYRTPAGALLIAATFLPQPTEVGVDDYLGWRVDCAVDDAERHDKVWAYAGTPAAVRVDGALRLHAEPNAVAAPRHLLRVVDNQLPGGSHLHFDMSPDAYDLQKAAYRKQGKYPIRLDFFDEKAPLRITALFASSDEPKGRSFRRSQDWPLEAAAFSVWDHQAEVKMKRSGIRGLQLAITYDDKLVFARAYTWAEMDYPDIALDTSFSLGSVSKPINSLALVRQFDQYTGTIPGLASWANANYWDNIQVSPVDSNLEGLTFRRLMTHSDGFFHNYCTESNDIEIAVERQATLPLAPSAAFDWLISQHDVGMDTDPTHYCYNGTGPLLLSQWLEKDAGLPYQKAMQQVLFSAAGVKHAHLVDQPLTKNGAIVPQKDAFRHRLYPELDFDHRKNSLPLTHAAYGRRNPVLMAPSGTWCMPATDLARILASMRAPSPLIGSNARILFVDTLEVGLVEKCGLPLAGELPMPLSSSQVTLGSWLRADLGGGQVRRGASRCGRRGVLPGDHARADVHTGEDRVRRHDQRRAPGCRPIRIWRVRRDTDPRPPGCQHSTVVAAR